MKRIVLFAACLAAVLDEDHLSFVETGGLVRGGGRGGRGTGAAAGKSGLVGNWSRFWRELHWLEVFLF